MEFFAIALIPILIAILAKFVLRLDICWIEWLIQTGLCVLIVGFIFLISNAGAHRDSRVVNGEVTKVYNERFRCYRNQIASRCTNDYQCNCREICTGTGKDRSCHTECDTCYRYPWEQNWYLDTNVNNTTIQISRVDRQGADTPPRWSRAKVGDPVSLTEGFTNYVRPVSDSLYSLGGLDLDEYKKKNLLPKWPSKIEDYHYIDRLVVVNTTVSAGSRAAWAKEIQESLKKTKMNVVVVVVKGQPQSYAQVLRSHWKGFKSNEGVIVIGLNEGNIVQWVESVSWAGEPMYDVRVRAVASPYVGKAFGTIAPKTFMEDMRVNAYPSFSPRPMSDFEYLKNSVRPSAGFLWFATILSVILSVGATVFFHVNDIRDLGNSGHGSYYRSKYKYRRY